MAAKVVKSVPPSLQLHREACESIAAWRSELYAAMVAYADARLAEAQAAWDAAGGCKRCRGYREVLTWWTLDGPGWDEHGPCPNCTGANVRGWPEPEIRPGASRPSSSSGVRDSAGFEWLAYQDPDFSEWARANWAAETERQRFALDKGAIAIVVKGRKVPVGLIAPVVAVKDGNYGPRVGLLVAAHVEGAVNGLLWTALDNVELARGLPNDLSAAMMIAYEQNRESYFRSKGLRHKPFYTPEQWQEVGVKMERAA